MDIDVLAKDVARLKSRVDDLVAGISYGKSVPYVTAQRSFEDEAKDLVDQVTAALKEVSDGVSSLVARVEAVEKAIASVPKDATVQFGEKPMPELAKAVPDALPPQPDPV